jgi:hypothetical protein
MKKIIPFALMALISGALVIYGCKKKEVASVDNETQSSVDNAVADQEYAGIVPTVNSHAINTKGTGASGNKMLVPCDTLTYISGDTSDFIPNVIYTLSVNNNTMCNPMPDGKTRAGALMIRLTGKIKNPGSEMIIKMLNYKTNNSIDYKCDSMIVRTVAFNTVSTTFSVSLRGGVCQSPAWTIKYSSERVITNYHHGNPYGTAPYTEVYGTADGVNRLGRTFHVDIPSSSPLVRSKACEYITKGVMQLTPQDFSTRIINFGDGTCDDKATFTVNGNTVTFTLK